jgi:hypothetical protein
MSTRALPEDIGTLSWLAEALGVGDSTCYRLAKTGELAEFGLFKVGAQYRCSKVKALRSIHGMETDSTPVAS